MPDNEYEDYRITKVILKKDSVEIAAERVVNGETRKAGTNSVQKPNPELPKALADLGKLMCKRVKMQGAWSEVARCTHVSVDYASEEHERKGMIATLYVPISDMAGGLTTNTPRMVEKIQGAKGGGCFMSDDILNTLNTVLREAMHYLEGNRAQGNLTDDLPKKGAPAEDEGEAAPAVH